MTRRYSVKYGKRYEIDRRSATFGLITSALFHVLLICSYFVVDEDVQPQISGPNGNGENSIFVQLNQSDPVIPVVGGGHRSPPSSGAGIPIIVPDFRKIVQDIVDPFVDQYLEYVHQASDSGPGGNFGGPGYGSDGSESALIGDVSDMDEDPPIFNPDVARYPEVIMKVTPDYPILAQRAGLEGKVSVLMLITRQGKVQKASVSKSDNEVFDSNTLQAASKWLFKPGMSNAGPIAVWVTVPFEFKLKK